jgi:hypothetical protein
MAFALSKLSLLQRMASNDNNGKCKLEEEVESLTARKRLQLSDNNGGDDDSSESPEEEMEEEETEEVQARMDFSTPNVNGQMIFFAR